MKKETKQRIIYYFILIIIGVVINRVGSQFITTVGLPMYLDSIGTMFVAVLGGITPGMAVGFITNMIGGMSDSNTFYYGTINVLIAMIAGRAANRGRFDKIYKVIAIVPFYMLLSIPVTLLTYVLYNGQIEEPVTKSIVMYFYNMGIPNFPSQVIGNLIIEVPDKLISLIIAYLLLIATPKVIREKFNKYSGKDISGMKKEELRAGSSLKNHIAFLLFFSGLAIAVVSFCISYKTYMEARMVGNTSVDILSIRKEAILFSGKTLSAVLGLLMCIVSFSIVLANRVVVTPLVKMTREMRKFVYDSTDGRDESVQKISDLNIHTGNEIEELYLALLKSVKDIDNYINKTNEQSKTISDLHINIITTLADIVESRDETTGNHVKRTAEYCMVIADKLRAEGHYKNQITDEFVNELTVSAPLHDIGKVKIPDAILNKPGRLTDEEFDVIKTHTTLGAEMLDNAVKTMGDTEYLTMAKDIALYHHEWWDGGKRGYPQELSGEDIPLAARIMAVADVLDALLSKRPYKDGYPLDKAFEIIKEESGTHFEPVIVEAMLKSKNNIIEIIDKYS